MAGAGRARLEAWLTARWRQPEPDVWARLLQPLSWVYGALSGLHRRLYQLGLLQVQRAPKPVIVVGNLIAGGAGKTPAVLALLPLLQAQGHRPGVISRGHGRDSRAVMLVSADTPAEQVGDEPLLIHLRSGVPVAVGADRAAAARALCAAHPELTVLVSDDGLQHHRLARDAQVLVFDERGIGNGLLLPAGPLRQPMPAAPPTNTLVLYSAGVASTAWAGHLGHRRLAGVLPLARWWAGHAGFVDKPEHATTADPWAGLRGRQVLAAAALAKPEAFFQMLAQQGLQIERLPLPDHATLHPLPWPPDTADVVVTEKDAVKLQPQAMGHTRVWVAALDFRPEPGFAEALHALCAATLPPP